MNDSKKHAVGRGLFVDGNPF